MAFPAASMAVMMLSSESGVSEDSGFGPAYGSVRESFSRVESILEEAGRGVSQYPKRPFKVSAKYLTNVAKQMELKDTNACSRDTVPVVMMPVSATMQPFLRFRA